MEKFYKLYLNNNFYMRLDNYDCNLENVIKKVKQVTNDKKTLFGTKKEVTEVEYFDSTIIIGVLKNGVMYDFITDKKVESSQKQVKTKTGFTKYVEERNCNSPNLSYYKKEELTKKEVYNILKQYSKEDIARYVESLELVEKRSLQSYQNYLSQKNKDEELEQEADKFIEDFKVMLKNRV